MSDAGASDVPSHVRTGQAFMHLYVAGERRIYGFIFTLTHDWSATEDILQETAQVMWSKFDTFKPGTDFVAWALAIARYQVMDYRKRRLRQSLFDNELTEQLAQRAAEHMADEDNRRHEALKTCLGKLTKRDRHLIELRYRLDTTIRDIAEKLGCHTKSVYRSLQRIRLQLFRCIQRAIALEGRE